MLQTAEGGLNEISNILGRMRELAVQSASDGVNGDDRASIDLEFQQLKAEITRIADGTEYNNTKLLNENLNSTISETTTVDITGDSAQAGTYTITASGADLTLTTSDGRSQTVTVTDATGATSASLTTSAGGTGNTLSFGSLGITLENTSGGDLSLSSSVASTSSGANVFSVGGGATVQVGANNVELEDRLRFSIGDHRADQSTGLNLASTNLTALGDAQSAINELDTAISKVNDSRGNIGAMQNRFEFTSSNLMNSIQNNSASMSTIRDADFAVEAADLARNQILTQSGTAMLAQANSLSQNVLSLIR